MKRVLPLLLAPTLLLGADKFYYPYPGDIVNEGGTWKGVDHLANIGQNMPLQVDLLVPSDLTVSFTDKEILDVLEKEFTEAGFTNAPSPKGEFYFFSLMVLVYPINDGLAATVQGRLFEEVQVKRTLIAKDHKLQAETWDQSVLIVAPTAEFNDLLFKTVKELGSGFIKRLQAFQSKHSSSLKTEEPK